jgi:hypothetical protein
LIIRFRTVVKDTKDTAYVFLALAAGTSSYFLAFAGTGVFAILAIALHLSNFGSLYKSEFLLRFRTGMGLSEQYGPIIEKHTKSASLLHSEPSADGHKTNLLTFDIVMKKDANMDVFTQKISEVKGLSEVTLIASKTDVDY